MQPSIGSEPALQARVAEDEDFAALKALLSTEAGWALEYERAGVRVWSEAATVQGALRTVKVVAEFPDVSPDALYDVLHDPDYRAVWDSHMIAAEDAGHINVNNDVGYYAMSCPAPLKNRDFVLQRSWLDMGQEKMILNHSVYHKNFPPRKGFVRAVSLMTGFVVRPLADIDRAGGSWLGYISRSDPRGTLPAWLVNRVTAQLAPRLVKQLHAAAKEYPAWKSSSSVPGHKPWLYPDQVPAHRISVLDCVNPEAKNSPEGQPKVPTISPKLEPRFENHAPSVEDLADFSSEFSLEIDIDHVEPSVHGEPSKRKGKFYKLVKGMRIRRKSVMEKKVKNVSSLELDKISQSTFGSGLNIDQNDGEKNGSHLELNTVDKGFDRKVKTEDREEKGKEKKEGYKFHRRFSRSKRGE